MAAVLRYLATRLDKAVSTLALDDLTGDRVLAFQKHLETERHDPIGTRNCRLAAVCSFYRFVADREPLAAAQCAAVLRIPMKKTVRTAVECLDSEEVAAILRQPDRLAQQPGDANLTEMKQAVMLLQPLLQQYPDHPGIAHYLIQACDTPGLA